MRWVQWVSMRPTLRACIRNASLVLLASLSVVLACATDANVDPLGSPDAGLPPDLESPRDGGGVDGSVASAPDASAPDASLTPPASRTSLVHPERWVALTQADDPFDDRPLLPRCTSGSVMPEMLAEEYVFSVDTGGCPYITVVQPALRAVAMGEILKIRLWHFELSASESAEAHAVVWVDGLVVLDERVAIPQAGGLIVSRLRVERPIAVGAPIHFHLHNHGANSWSLVEVSAGP